MTEQEIHTICKEYNITNYTINRDGSIDVNGSVYLYNMDLTEIPLKFNKVSGYFDCSNNQLKSLKGSPKKVGGNFYCSYNHITSLKGSPESVRGSFYCMDNPLESFEGYNSSYDKIINTNKEKLIRKTKLKLIENL